METLQSVWLHCNCQSSSSTDLIVSDMAHNMT